MRIAIIRLSSLGDVVISSSMLAALKSVQDCRVEWFVDERFAGVLEKSPCINKIHKFPFQKMLKSLTGLVEIRSYAKNIGKYDMVIDMQGLIKSASIGKCLSTNKFVGFSKNGCREGMASYLYSHKVDISYDSNILERNFKVLFSHINKFNESVMPLSKAIELRSQSLGISYHNLDPELLKMLQQNETIGEKTFKILFILEASIPEKVYPIKNYAMLSRLITRFIPNSEFFLVWNEDSDRADDLLEMIKQQNIRVCKLPKLSMNNLKFVMKQMDCVIGGDTGVTHLAWVMGAPTITLYGNSSKTSGKNMRDTSIERVLLGNPYIVSKSNRFEIASISPDEILRTIKTSVQLSSRYL
ncbi:lipopolysaccharide heptosyltransferase I [Helicobacter muridarum]|uniref:Lipopolysaccharide heptosyltransferase 1 n=1 Tax=Helicobacter muridarum TaxID=216 RepID=A0A377PRA4_9HELI|nr:lipopolysaccharide heptosyltransferase I [Helicobacter muridarum]TLD99417.1 lipopolysaccharide heptosyltransferase I [Helicobacter muridarum]STQ85498.1 lipopolysaccharide heptosyltransferase-1 [Helicobacter muridarum]